MPEDWKIYKLGDVARIGDGAHSKVKRVNDGVLYLTSKNFKEGKLNLERIDYISENDYNRLFSASLKAVNKPESGDVILGIIGTLGNAYVFKDSDKFGISSSVALIRPNSSIINSQYLYFYITSNEFKHYQNAHNGASVQGYTNIPSLKSIPITLPPLPEQIAIASILSALDDKIELNLQQNKTLEEMAMALYKHWFVDFGPFQNGEFVESELGLIPSGWKVSNLGEVSELLAGGDKPKNYSIEPNEVCSIPIYSNGLTNEGLYGYTDIARINDESITVSARGTIGYVCLRMQPYFPIVRLISVIPNRNFISSKYLFLWLKNQNISGTGTSQQQITVPDFKKTIVLIPKIELVNDFTNIMDSIFNNIRSNKLENQTLTTLRDTLLPKLISGEVRVKEAQQILSSVL